LPANSRRGHGFLDLFFHGIQIEYRARLHRRGSPCRLCYLVYDFLHNTNRQNSLKNQL
jgi:hypothetical protein